MSQRRRPHTLGTSLSLFALGCTLPVAAVAAGLVYFLLAESYARTQSELADRRELMAGAVESRIQNVVEDLQVLAASPAIRDGDFRSFREHMATVGTVIGAFGVVLVDRQGQILISSRRPLGEPLPKRSNLSTQEQVFATGKSQVSDIVASTAGGAPIISVEVPVLRNGNVDYVLAVGLSPGYFANVVNSQVPTGWVGSIADGQGLLIARVPELPVIGQPTIGPLRERIGQSSGNWIKVASRTGGVVYSSFRRIEPLGWTIFLSIPADLSDQEYRKTAMSLAALLLVALATSLLLARQMSRRIVAALGALEHNVAALTHGRTQGPVPNTLVEVERMQAVLSKVKTELDTTEQRIERERSLLKSTVQSMPLGVLLIDKDENVLLINRKALDLWALETVKRFDDFKNVARLKSDGRPYPPNDWPIMRALRGGAQTEDELVFHDIPGRGRVRLSINAAPVRDADGEIIAAVAAFYDVTALHDSLDQQQLLLDEINHRVKNTMANIQSIALLTRSGAGSVEQYVNGFQQRLLALSRAYNLLTENNWRGADIRQIVEMTTAPYGRSAQIEIFGADVQLTSKHALALTAALQELCTNAAKYGALSVPEGKLHIHWRCFEQHVELRWLESNGPRVEPPTRRGFGSKLLQDILTQDPDWSVKVLFEPSGVVACVILHISAAIETAPLRVPA
jgi:two-component sensor histidine kinase